MCSKNHINDNKCTITGQWLPERFRLISGGRPCSTEPPRLCRSAGPPCTWPALLGCLTSRRSSAPATPHPRRSGARQSTAPSADWSVLDLATWSLPEPSFVQLHIAPAQRRGLRTPEQSFPHHLQKCQIHGGTPHRLDLRSLPPAFSLVRALDLHGGLHRGIASLVSPFACRRGLPCSLTRGLRVALTRESDTGSGCLPRRCAAAIAARQGGRWTGTSPPFPL